MSYLARRVIPLRTSYVSIRPIAQQRSLHISSQLRSLNESDHSHDTEARKKNIDSNKNDSLSKAKDGKGHWKRDLASQSEAAIKADRNEVQDSDDPFGKAEQAEKTFKEGKVGGQEAEKKFKD